MKLISAGLRYDVDQPTAVAAVFGVSVAADDSKLRDRI
jgi:hypothetical protein